MITLTLAVLTGRERGQWPHPDLLLTVFEAVRTVMTMSECQIGLTRVYGGHPVSKARNTAVREFLKQSDRQWLLMIDNDTVPAPGFFGALVEGIQQGKKIIGFPAPMTQGDSLAESLQTISFNVGIHQASGGFKASSNLQRGWYRADLVGAACLAVHREVFDSLGYPWFEQPALREETAH